MLPWAGRWAVAVGRVVVAARFCIGIKAGADTATFTAPCLGVSAFSNWRTFTMRTMSIGTKITTKP